MASPESPYPNNSRQVSGTVYVNDDDVILLCNTSSATVTINLQSLPSNFNVLYKLYIKDNSNNASTNNITIVAPTGFEINNQQSFVINQSGASYIIFITSSTDYFCFSTFNNKIFPNATVRLASVPDFIGQIGVETDTNQIYIGTALTAGSWTPIKTTRTFANSTARGLAVPDFIGQFGSQLDTSIGYISTGLSAGNWTVIASGGGTIGGSGTLNYVAKFTPNGTTIGNSQIFDNGTNVGINTNTPSFPLTLNASGYGFVQTNGTIEMGFYTAGTDALVGTKTNHGLGLFVNNGSSAIYINTSKQVGINQLTPTAILHTVGLGSTSSTFSTKIFNSSASNLLSIRDDGSYYFGVPNDGSFSNGFIYKFADTSHLFRIWTTTNSSTLSISDLGATVFKSRDTASSNIVFSTIDYTNGYNMFQFVNGTTAFGVSNGSSLGDNFQIKNKANTANVFALYPNATNVTLFSIGDDGAAYIKTNLAVGATSPNASAIVDFTSTTKGFLFPRGTTTEKNAISSPADGLFFYDNTLHVPYYYNGTIWTSLVGGGSGNTTQTFTDATARLAATPTFDGQLGIQLDTYTVYTSFGISVGEWQLPYNTQTQSDTYAVASGTNNYTASLTPNLLSYTNGNTFRLKFTNANTGASDIDIDGAGAISIKKYGTTALVSGDIPAGGIGEISYDGTNFQLLNPKVVIPSLSGYVPYTGATTNLNMGSNDISLRNITLAHIIGSQGLTNSFTGAGAGSGASSSTSGTDLAGNLTLNTGLIPTASSIQVGVTFGASYGSAPRCVLISAGNAAAAALLGNTTSAPYIKVSDISTTTFSISSNTTPLASSTTYVFYYIVIQ